MTHLTQKHSIRPRERTLTRRAVLWLGQTCNLRCHFCYFLDRIQDPRHIEHPFMSLDKAKEICHTLRYFYGNTSIDIQGGEPTIYPGILELVSYCRDIGLSPTLITNGLKLADRREVEKLRDAGVADFLCSLHGTGQQHDDAVGRKGAHEKLIRAIGHMRDLNVPFRINCTMCEAVIPTLNGVAQTAIDYGAVVVNFIAFNPFEDQQSGKRTADNVARYSEIKPHLTTAVDRLEDAGIEVNIRYFPFCMVEERHRKNIYNFQQLPYDHWEWDFQSWNWTGRQPQRMKAGCAEPPFLLGREGFSFAGPFRRVRIWNRFVKNLARPFYRIHNALTVRLQNTEGKDRLYRREGKKRAFRDHNYTHHALCGECSLRGICDGFHKDYVSLFGHKEARPVKSAPAIEDPLAFAKHQPKRSCAAS